MAFDEVQFPVNISYGSSGGPQFNTSIVILDSGIESRNINWAKSRAKYNVSYGIRDHADLLTVQKFFLARHGRAYGFRYKDHLDYSVTQEALAQTGAPTVQLIKTYTSGPRSYVRTISKPIAPITMRRNGGSFTTFTLDSTTGIVTLTPLSTINITNITQANPGVVTTSGNHGFSNGDKIWIKNVGGMTQVNNLIFTIAGASGNTFNLGISTASYTAYTAGGTAEKHVQPADTFDWTGEFDVPVRFDSDHLPATLEDFSIGSQDFTLIEVRI